MPFDAFFNSLFKMAAKKPISVFKQGVHTGAEPKAVTDPRAGGKTWQLSPEVHAQVIGGFCAGASLDWLRKVLQEPKSIGIDHLKESRVNRMAQTFVKQSGMKSILDDKVAKLKKDATSHAETASAAIRPAEEALDQHRAEFKAWVLRNNGTWTASGEISLKGADPQVSNLFQQKLAQLKSLNTEYGRALVRHDELIDKANALTRQSDAEVEKWNAASDSGKRGLVWNELATGMGTDAGKSRRFSGICPVQASPKVSFPTLKEFLVSALSTPAFSPGRGMYISLSFTPPPGHAIALHREQSNTINLYDPNLGIYKFTDLKMLLLALYVLVETGYLGRDPTSGKETGLADDCEWQVFAKMSADGALPLVNGPEFANADAVKIAFDESVEFVNSCTVYAKEGLADALREAADARAHYESISKTGTQQQINEAFDAWIVEHNAATQAFDQARGSDLASAQRAYPKFTGRGVAPRKA